MAIFVSAALLFWVQPLFGRLALPLLGGAPAVWTTAMMFFQGALLAGYAYAHLSVRLLGRRGQVLLHLGLFAAAAAFLPVGLAAGSVPEAGQSPVLWLLLTMAISIGVPFLVLSATAPLLQSWFAAGGREGMRDPYFLYAASNLGSLAALLGYPLVIEPSLVLAGQAQVWLMGFILLAALVVACGVRAWRAAASPGATAASGAFAAPPAVGWWDRLAWIALSFVPSSMLLGVTSFISVDLAAGPLVWIVPLALYLLSFVLVFARPMLPHGWMRMGLPLALIAAVASLVGANRLDIPFSLDLALHLLAFFVTAMVCHGALALRRPHPAHLTQFYLLVAVGGLLGGVFNALVAPVAFDSLLEYPLVLALAGLLRRAPAGRGKTRLSDVLGPAGLLFAFFALWFAKLLWELDPEGVAQAALLLGAAVIALFMARRPLAFALYLAAGLAQAMLPTPGEDVLLQERNFYGVHKVQRVDHGRIVELMHGTTSHGMQVDLRDHRYEPASYYARRGPLGQFFAALPASPVPRRIGVVGLGTGATSCYRRPGEAWTFFEIDPSMARVAGDTRYFDYLAHCAPEADVVLGDARLTLGRQPDATFDVLILDAFNSDAIPTHLLTREAFATYERKLAPGGVIVLHISNRLLRLAPVLARVVEDAGLVGRSNDFGLFGAPAAFVDDSEWAVAARSQDDLSFLNRNPAWMPLVADPGTRLWTDDHADLLGALM